MNAQLQVDFLHAMFQMKSLLASELGKSDTVGINTPEYVLLKRIGEKSSSLNEIREYLAISKSAVSQMLRSLEKKGFIYREADPTDRRNVIVTLTAAGERAMQKKEAAFNARFGKLLHSMSEDNLRQTIALVSRFRDSVSPGHNGEQEEISE